jgi:hypothetical protein
MAVLPFIEQVGVYNSCNFSVSWDAAENLTVRATRVNTFFRPEDDKEGPPLTKFLAVVGPSTPFPGPVNLTFDDLRDGMTTTILFGEVASSDILWAEPRDLRFDSMDFLVNGPRKKMGFGSPYDGGPRVLMADGSIKVLKNGTSPAVIRALVTASGGEAIREDGQDWSLAPPAGP